MWIFQHIGFWKVFPTTEMMQVRSVASGRVINGFLGNDWVDGWMFLNVCPGCLRCQKHQICQFFINKIGWLIDSRLAKLLLSLLNRTGHCYKVLAFLYRYLEWDTQFERSVKNAKGGKTTAEIFTMVVDDSGQTLIVRWGVSVAGLSQVQVRVLFRLFFLGEPSWGT